MKDRFVVLVVGAIFYVAGFWIFDTYMLFGLASLSLGVIMVLLSGQMQTQEKIDRLIKRNDLAE